MYDNFIYLFTLNVVPFPTSLRLRSNVLYFRVHILVVKNKECLKSTQLWSMQNVAITSKTYSKYIFFFIFC